MREWTDRCEFHGCPLIRGRCTTCWVRRQELHRSQMRIRALDPKDKLDVWRMPMSEVEDALGESDHA